MTFFCATANSYAIGFAIPWKSTFQYLHMRFCPENVGNWSSSPQNGLEFSPRSIQSCFPLLQGLSCRKSPSALALFRSNWVKYDYNPQLDRKKHLQHFFDPFGSNTITIPDQIEKKSNSVGSKKVFFFDPIGDCDNIWPSWIEKVLTMISCNWPLEKREAALDRFGENPCSFWGEEDQFPTFSGQKLMRTYWKVLFQRTANPTPYVRIGLINENSWYFTCHVWSHVSWYFQTV